jgi:hypothetical protein
MATIAGRTARSAVDFPGLIIKIKDYGKLFSTLFQKKLAHGPFDHGGYQLLRIGDPGLGW